MQTFINAFEQDFVLVQGRLGIGEPLFDKKKIKNQRQFN